MGQRAFDNFQEFLILTRPLTDDQRKTLLECMSLADRRLLLRNYSAEGWDDLQIQNHIDGLLDHIREKYNEDLILIRIQVLSGQLRKVRKIFWEYVIQLFSDYSIRHKWHIFEGIATKEHSNEWILLVPSKRGIHGQKEDCDGR